MGGAGITPGVGQWKNVKAIYPMHNDKVNQALLRGLSKKLLLGIEDLDKIRDLFGSKVCEFTAAVQLFLEIFANYLLSRHRYHFTLHLVNHIRLFSSSPPLPASSPGYGFPSTPSFIQS